MDETLHQLEGLLLGSVPTIFLFLLLVILYRLLVYGPLTRVLSERRERTEGAVEQAKSALQVQTSAAHRTIEGSIDQLAGEILAAILPKNRAAVGRAR